MRRVKTYFEQVPVDVVKEAVILGEVSPLDGSTAGRAKEPAAYRRTCAICGKAVSLETCKTNEDGLAVHGDCAVASLAPKRSTQVSTGR